MIVQRAVQSFGFGAICVAFSELWFYQVALDWDILFLVAAYSAMAWPMLAWVGHFQVAGFDRFFFCAALYGYLIEGVLVPTIYLAFPFQLLWTALAWHALLTIAVGYYLLRRWLVQKPALHVVLLTTAMGVFLGVWGAYLWNVVEGGDVLTWDWHPVVAFALQTAAAYGLFLTGNVLLDISPHVARPSRVEMGVATGCVLLLWALGALPVAFPLSLIFPVILGCMAWALSRKATRGSWSHGRVGWRRYALTLPLPIMAIAAYAVIVSQEWGFATNVPVALITCAVSFWLLARSIWRVVNGSAAGKAIAPATSPL